jgi:hypothetical protein
VLIKPRTGKEDGMVSLHIFHILAIEFFRLCIVHILIIQRTCIKHKTPPLKKWSFNIHSITTSRLLDIFMGFLLYNSIKLQQNEMQQKYSSKLFIGESIGGEKNGLLYKRNLDGEFPLRQP